MVDEKLLYYLPAAIVITKNSGSGSPCYPQSNPIDSPTQHPGFSWSYHLST